MAKIVAKVSGENPMQHSMQMEVNVWKDNSFTKYILPPHYLYYNKIRSHLMSLREDSHTINIIRIYSHILNTHI